MTTCFRDKQISHLFRNITLVLSCFLSHPVVSFFQVHQELSQYTLHLCALLVDKFLVKQAIMLDTLQLLGITSLLIAAKYHERFPPEVRPI